LRRFPDHPCQSVVLFFLSFGRPETAGLVFNGLQ
jgi:hypothetical protein